MSEKRKKYDREFREGAVRIVRETGKSIAQVARDLGIHEGTRTISGNSNGCVARSLSCGWSVMSSSDQWSCGCYADILSGVAGPPSVMDDNRSSRSRRVL